jgi:hypothetical protein
MLKGRSCGDMRVSSAWSECEHGHKALTIVIVTK